MVTINGRLAMSTKFDEFDPLQSSATEEEGSETNAIFGRSFMRALHQVVIKIPEGVVSLGAELN
jgi:hypothetical protein